MASGLSRVLVFTIISVFVGLSLFTSWNEKVAKLREVSTAETVSSVILHKKSNDDVCKPVHVRLSPLLAQENVFSEAEAYARQYTQAMRTMRRQPLKRGSVTQVPGSLTFVGTAADLQNLKYLFHVLLTAKLWSTVHEIIPIVMLQVTQDSDHEVYGKYRDLIRAAGGIPIPVNTSLWETRLSAHVLQNSRIAGVWLPWLQTGDLYATTDVDFWPLSPTFWSQFFDHMRSNLNLSSAIECSATHSTPKLSSTHRAEKIKQNISNCEQSSCFLGAERAGFTVYNGNFYASASASTTNDDFLALSVLGTSVAGWRMLLSHVRSVHKWRNSSSSILQEVQHSECGQRNVSWPPGFDILSASIHSILQSGFETDPALATTSGEHGSQMWSWDQRIVGRLVTLLGVNAPHCCCRWQSGAVPATWNKTCSMNVMNRTDCLLGPFVINPSISRVDRIAWPSTPSTALVLGNTDAHIPTVNPFFKCESQDGCDRSSPYWKRGVGVISPLWDAIAALPSISTQCSESIRLFLPNYVEQLHTHICKDTSVAWNKLRMSFSESRAFCQLQKTFAMGEL